MHKKNNIGTVERTLNANGYFIVKKNKKNMRERESGFVAVKQPAYSIF